jgi:signal transduction histidine kinase
MATLRTKLVAGYGGMLALSLASLIALFRGYDLLAAGLIAAEQLLAGVFLFLMARLVVRSLQDMTRSTKAFQAAQAAASSTRPPPPPTPAAASRQDELGDLARSIHAMASSDQAQLASEQDQRLRAQDSARSVINSLPHAVALLSPGGRVEVVNAHAAKFGLAPGQNVYASPLQWLPPLLDEALATGSPAGSGVRGAEAAQRESFVQMFDAGRELFFLPQLSPMLDEKGALIGVTLVLLDVTQERAVSEAKQGLLSTVSHQLKTPMTSIQMSIHLLLEDAVDRLTPRQAELLQTARDDADRLYRLIEEMLAAARRS